MNQTYNDPMLTSIYYHRNNEIIDISKYKKMEYYESRIKNNKIEINENYYDIKKYIERVKEYYIENNDIDDYMEENNIINMSLSYNENYLRLEGYILYKGE